jgi:hypothetical protein
MRVKIDKKKIKTSFLLKMKLKRIITFRRGLRKILDIKIMRTKIENIIHLIWIER